MACVGLSFFNSPRPSVYVIYITDMLDGIFMRTCKIPRKDTIQMSVMYITYTEGRGELEKERPTQIKTSSKYRKLNASSKYHELSGRNTEPNNEPNTFRTNRLCILHILRGEGNWKKRGPHTTQHIIGISRTQCVIEISRTQCAIYTSRTQWVKC